MTEQVTRDEVIKAMVFLDGEHAKQRKFWGEHYHEANDGVGGSIMVLHKLARQWLEEHPDPGELVMSYCATTYCSDKDDFLAPRVGYCPRCGAPAFPRRHIG